MKLRAIPAVMVACSLTVGCASRPEPGDAASSSARAAEDKPAAAEAVADASGAAKATEDRQGKPFDSAQGKPLKVYILAGQSNMTGMVSPRTLEHIKMFPDTAKEFADLFDSDGNPVVLDDVRVAQWKEKEGGALAPKYGGGKSGGFGPEFPFGVYMYKALKEPFLIIKTSQGGKDINYHFRSPSAGTWTPPPGHPDLVKKEDVKLPQLPIPAKLDLPDDYTPEKPHALTKRHMGLKGFKGAEIGKVNGVSPLYVLNAPRDKIEGDPFKKGDLILGVDGSGLRDDPVAHWRHAFHSSRTIDGDWRIEITRWRKGKIETFDFDICDTIEGGRAKLPEQIEAMKQAEVEKEKLRGGYYRDMIAYVRTVLQDVKKHHPAYDPKAGYEIAGFVWFQGWNDMINTGVYPNRAKPRGYEQYTWLLEHFIRDVRKDLDAPGMPFVIGVIGVGGVDDPPTGNMGYLQQAQAAPADSPEFKGTVAAVHTGRYWDHELDALVSKSSKVRSKMNDFKFEDGLEGEALKKAYDEYRAKHITPREEEILKKAVSNAGFHYLGSAKIMCGIGKGFAEAMLELEERNAK
jgi:hypothetical protein